MALAKPSHERWPAYPITICQIGEMLHRMDDGGVVGTCALVWWEPCHRSLCIKAGACWMELRLEAELESFRLEVRSFIAGILPAEMKERQRRKVANNASVPDLLEWMRILHSHGRSVPHWPVEHGGCGWSPMQLFIFNEELYKADAPEFDWGGTHMLGPVLYTYGSDYLKERFLPIIRE